MLVNKKISKDSTVQTLRVQMSIYKRLKIKALKGIRERRYEEFTEAAARGNDCLLSPASSSFTEWPSQVPAKSIINLHWVAGCIDVPTFFKATGENHHLVWTMHDLWPITGGCHYTSGCDRFTLNCGLCPQILSSNENDATRIVWKDKSFGYGSLPPNKMTVITPSTWLGREARRSSLLGRFDIKVIPYGIDLTAFAPRDFGMARETLGIPLNSFVIGFVADSLTTPRKGFQVLLKALEQISIRSGITLLSVGSGEPNIPVEYHSLHQGKVQSDRLLSLIYSAMDVFIIPTQEDNLPLTVLESLACGTPVIGSDVGGVPDMVRPEKTGFLFPNGDSAKLARILSDVMQHRELLSSMRPTCRAIAEREYNMELQAARYRSIYETLGRHEPSSVC